MQLLCFNVLLYTSMELSVLIVFSILIHFDDLLFLSFHFYFGQTALTASGSRLDPW